MDEIDIEGNNIDFEKMSLEVRKSCKQISKILKLQFNLGPVDFQSPLFAHFHWNLTQILLVLN